MFPCTVAQKGRCCSPAFLQVSRWSIDSQGRDRMVRTGAWVRGALLAAGCCLGFVAPAAAGGAGNDARTTLTYGQQRYYEPHAGRFVSVDPVQTNVNDGGSFNR